MENEDRIREIARLRVRLSELRERRAVFHSRIAELSRSIRDVRERLGNPFFYSGAKHGRPENASQTVLKYTGYKSHEPGLTLVLEALANEREIKNTGEQLRALNINPDDE